MLLPVVLSLTLKSCNLFYSGIFPFAFVLFFVAVVVDSVLNQIHSFNVDTHSTVDSQL